MLMVPSAVVTPGLRFFGSDSGCGVAVAAAVVSAAEPRSCIRDRERTRARYRAQPRPVVLGIGCQRHLTELSLGCGPSDQGWPASGAGSAGSAGRGADVEPGNHSADGIVSGSVDVNWMNAVNAEFAAACTLCSPRQHPRLDTWTVTPGYVGRRGPLRYRRTTPCLAGPNRFRWRRCNDLCTRLRRLVQSRIGGRSRSSFVMTGMWLRIDCAIG